MPPKPKAEPLKGPPKGPKPNRKTKPVSKSGLGHAIMNKKSKQSKGYYNEQGEFRYTTEDAAEPSWVKLRSITQEKALDEFLSTAQLADTDFTAERNTSTTIISKEEDGENQFLLKDEQERALKVRHVQNAGKLTVPRRPIWDSNTSKTQLDREERDAFLDWRRGLAEMEENQDLLLTPFERNIEVWRQLWRVVERSDLVVQIVDARNPLMFRSEDLDNYVLELDSRKRNLLLINKSDLLTKKQRIAWARYFKGKGVEYAFFSAAKANEQLEAEALLEEQLEAEALGRANVQDISSEEEEEEENEDEEEEEEEEEEDFDDYLEDLNEEDFDSEHDDEYIQELERKKLEAQKPKQDEEEFTEANDDQDDEEDDSNDEGLDIHVLAINELEDLFLSVAPEPLTPSPDPSIAPRLNIGLVGYPNVGKSSTINALIGSKKVSVSATPGKTKHFQTILLSPTVVLCDCPGLVFPNFASTNGDLVCNGVLPIDQLREVTGPIGLVTQRIPQYYLEAVYGIAIFTKPLADGGSGIPTASEFLVAYARARGYMRAGHGKGNPDESRAARYILKDYVNGKLLFCHPPPKLENPEEYIMDRREFNFEHYKLSTLPESRRQQIESAALSSGLIKSTENNAIDNIDLEKDLAKLSFSQHTQMFKSAGSQIDKDFFAQEGIQGRQTLPFHKTLTTGTKGNKKHFKANKKMLRKTNDRNDSSYVGSYNDLF
ncbi:P-loop containing nucleoside triphosphate hydrolase protein [Nadsonia fulvescens var. elongata DSM 6958]|uniref:p-loop containing nucleoside triphosphate hydrolase protein n=1 Tax=Nadsonia fulvescens var. elongata DSM 6958 TaxID=857566 RepID=A0A1E3PPD6_9ASCO|nr:P-loop containing nucleoside triphosphate hydrolase protein [Nadsonia fulvescens var. elongata DSM 6958]